MYRIFSLLLALSLVLAGGGAVHPAGARPSEASVGARAVTFSEERAALLASLSTVRAAASTRAQGDGEAALLLDLAELHLEVAFVPEGAAIVAALADAPLRSAQSARRGALRAAFASLDARAPAAAPPPLRALGDLPGAAAIHALALSRAGRIADALDLITHSRSSLDGAPPALRARVLPGLLDAAVTAGRPALAAALHGRLIRVAALAEPGALAYLSARRDAAAGDTAAAAAGFAAAGAAGTVWGHRARLAEIDLGLASGTLDSAQALERLAGARALWRGDEEALGTLRRIARLAAETGDLRGAAEARGEIWWRSGRAGAAANEALAALRAFYAAGASGDLALHDLMEGHRYLARLFRLLPGYAALSETFADHMLSRGATGAAAAEYALTRAYLEFGAEKGLWEPSPSRLDTLRLKEAGAHLAGGRAGAAQPLLQGPLRAAAAQDMARLAELRMRHLVLTGDAPAAAAPAMSDTAPELLARVARAHVLAGRWAPALDVYRGLWRATDGQVAPQDAVGALLAAHHGGDETMLARAERSLAAAGGLRAAAVEGGLAADSVAQALDTARLRDALDRADGALRVGAGLAEDAPGDSAGERGGLNTSLTGGP